MKPHGQIRRSNDAQVPGHFCLPPLQVQAARTQPESKPRQDRLPEMWIHQAAAETKEINSP